MKLYEIERTEGIFFVRGLHTQPNDLNIHHGVWLAIQGLSLTLMCVDRINYNPVPFRLIGTAEACFLGAKLYTITISGTILNQGWDSGSNQFSGTVILGQVEAIDIYIQQV